MLLMHTERWFVDVCTNPNYNLIVSSKTSKLVWSHLQQQSEIWVKFSLIITISHKQAALMVNLHKQGYACVHFTFHSSEIRIWESYLVEFLLDKNTFYSKKAHISWAATALIFLSVRESTEANGDVEIKGGERCCTIGGLGSDLHSTDTKEV